MIKMLVVIMGSCLLAADMCRAQDYSKAEAMMKDPAEFQAFKTIADLFEKGPEITWGGTAIRMDGLKEKKGRRYIVFQVDKNAGRVHRILTESLCLANEDWTLFAPFTELALFDVHVNGPSDISQDWYGPIWNDYDGRGLTALSGLTKLKEIRLWGTGVKKDGVKALAQLRTVESFSLLHCQMSDADAEAFRGHPNLKHIYVGQEYGGFGGHDHWLDGYIGEKSLEPISDCPKLEHVEMAECFLSWENGLRHLLKRKGTLKKLTLHLVLVDPADMARFKKEMPDVAVEWNGLVPVGRDIFTDHRNACDACNIQQASQEVRDLFRNAGVSEELLQQAAKAFVEAKMAESRHSVGETLTVVLRNMGSADKGLDLSLSPDNELRKILATTGFASRDAQWQEAIRGRGITLVDADAQTLQSLLEKKKDVLEYCERGGWLVLSGLKPDGLDNFNQLVGYKHMIRRYDGTKVSIGGDPGPLGKGLPGTAKRIGVGRAGFIVDKPIFRVLSDTRWDGPEDTKVLSYVIDHLDIAPFSVISGMPPTTRKTDLLDKSAHPVKLINGFDSTEFWAYAYRLGADKDTIPTFTITLPREMELDAFKLQPALKLYCPIKKIRVSAAGMPEPVVAAVPDVGAAKPVAIALNGVKTKWLKVEIIEWQNTEGPQLVAIDNIWLEQKRSPEYRADVRSLLSVGALMSYRVGKGGILLNQFAPVPANEAVAETMKTFAETCENERQAFKPWRSIDKK